MDIIFSCNLLLLCAPIQVLSWLSGWWPSTGLGPTHTCPTPATWTLRLACWPPWRRPCSSGTFYTAAMTVSRHRLYSSAAHWRHLSHALTMTMWSRLVEPMGLHHAGQWDVRGTQLKGLSNTDVLFYLRASSVLREGFSRSFNATELSCTTTIKVYFHSITHETLKLVAAKCTKNTVVLCSNFFSKKQL